MTMVRSGCESLRTELLRLYRDEEGQDLIEYGLLSAIIGISSLLLYTNVAPAMSAAYLSRLDAHRDAWTPPDPLAP
jgi:Flp pilus assembly pilin Flp